MREAVPDQERGLGGGQNWTGPTQCPPGAYCKNDGKWDLASFCPPVALALQQQKLIRLSLSIWYSQCVAIEQDGSQPSATIRTLNTVFSAGPTVVSTRITYLTPRPTTTTSVSVVTITLVPDDPCDHEYLC
jgi:hypothetical protein